MHICPACTWACSVSAVSKVMTRNTRIALLMGNMGTPQQRLQLHHYQQVSISIGGSGVPRVMELSPMPLMVVEMALALIVSLT